MKRMKKLLNRVRGFLPVTHREMKKVVTNIVTAMDGFATSSITQIQLTTGLIKEIEKIKADENAKFSPNDKAKKDKSKKEIKGYE